MKKTTINILSLTLLLGLGACKKQLDLFPFNQIEVSQSFKTVKDAQAWNNGLYADLRGRVYGGYNIPQEVQADYLNATLDYGNRNGNPHRWGQSLLADDGIFSGTWQPYYAAIRNLNISLAGFDNIPTNTTAEQTAMNRYKGDIYLARAYYYSELIVRFGKPYEPATAATDLGVPIITKYSLVDRPARATVKEVYDFILSDLAEAKTRLAAVNGAQGSNRFTIDAAHALEARVRLHMQDWAGAMAAANLAIGNGAKYPLITSATELRSMWTNDLAKETIMQLAVVLQTEQANTNAIYLGYRAADGKFAPDFVPTQTIIDLYANNDIRKAVYFDQKPVIIQGVNFPNFTVVNKYPGNPALFTTAATNYQHAPKVFRVAEQYLIYAEAAQRAGGASEALGLARLNELRQARGLTPVAATGTALRDAIREERTRELAFEGFRLWDLKRWHLGFTRGTPQQLNPIQQGANFNLLTIPADDPKFVWAVPAYEMTINTNLVQNSGY